MQSVNVSCLPTQCLFGAFMWNAKCKQFLVGECDCMTIVFRTFTFIFSCILYSHIFLLYIVAFSLKIICCWLFFCDFLYRFFMFFFSVCLNIFVEEVYFPKCVKHKERNDALHFWQWCVIWTSCVPKVHFLKLVSSWYAVAKCCISF